MTIATYYADIANGPDRYQAHFITASDNIKLRTALWETENATGTVFLLPGRTEYIEKYAPLATRLMQKGYSCLSIDWRGQGLSDRQHNDKFAGHVLDFDEYQTDFDSLLRYAYDKKLPKPWHFIAHSMGGAIGLRRLHKPHDFSSVAFSAPMWGIEMPFALRMLVPAMLGFFKTFSMMNKYAIGTDQTCYAATTEFEENTLTADTDGFLFLQKQLNAHPELLLGGPTNYWVDAAIKECKQLMSAKAPNTPTLCFLGTDEQIVDPKSIHTRMQNWSNGKLVMIPNARHELFMQGDTIVNNVVDQIITHFQAHS